MIQKTEVRLLPAVGSCMPLTMPHLVGAMAAKISVFFANMLHMWPPDEPPVA